jgi:ABC-type nickel/cobalt efflux system permease component RcnA
MTNTGEHESDVRSKSRAIVYLCGAIVVLMFSILTFGNASEWFDYVSGVIFVGLAAALTYRGMQSLMAARVAADLPAPKN